jgi:transcriptional regulator with XRE-family HTH domain
MGSVRPVKPAKNKHVKPGRIQLADFMEEKDAAMRAGKRFRQPQLADLFDVSDATVSRWLRAGLDGGRFPDLDSALLVQRVTGIPVAAWGRDVSEAWAA